MSGGEVRLSLRPAAPPTVSPAVPALATAMALWGGTYVVTKLALADAGPFTVLLLRLGIASLVLFPFARRQAFRWSLAIRKEFVLFGLTGFVLHLGFEVAGLKFTSASSAALVIATAPAVTVAFSIAFLNERLTLLRWAGIALSITGVVLITGGQGDADYPTGWFGNLLVFAGVLMWGVFTVQGKKMSIDHSPLVATTASSVAATLMFLPLAGIEVAMTGLPTFGVGSIVAIVYLGVFASALAYGLWNLALRHVEASVAGPFINLVPVIGIALALFVGESVTPMQVAGGATVGAGVWMSHKG